MKQIKQSFPDAGCEGHRELAALKKKKLAEDQDEGQRGCCDQGDGPRAVGVGQE